MDIVLIHVLANIARVGISKNAVVSLSGFSDRPTRDKFIDISDEWNVPFLRHSVLRPQIKAQ